MFFSLTQLLFHLQASFIYCVCVYHVWSAVHPLRADDVRAGLQTFCKELSKKVFGLLWCSNTAPLSPLSKAIQDQMTEFRLAKCSKLLSVILHCLAPLLFMTVVVTHINAVSAPPDDFLVVTFCFYGCAYAGGVLVCTGKIELTSCRLDIFIAAVNLLLLGMVGTMTDNPNFFMQHSVRLFMRIALSIAHLDFWKSIPWNIAYSIVTCWRFPYNCSTIEFGEAYHDDMMHAFFLREVFLCVGVNWGCYAVQMWLEGRIQLQIIAHNQKRATLKLAAYQCDAVCWLSPDLRLSGPAPQLAHMLFVEDPNNHLRGRQFENYIANDEDRERFRDFVALSIAASEPDGLPALLHVDLRDSTGRTFPVEVFHSCFADDSERMGHVVGISENPGRPAFEQQRGEALQATRDLGATDSLAPAQLGRFLSDPGSLRVPPSVARSTAESVASDVTPLFVPLIPEHRGLPPVSIMFDGWTHRIVGCTNGFMTLVGPVAYQTHMRQYLINYREFVPWMQTWVNDLLDTLEPRNDSFSLRLAPSGPKKSRKFEFHADVYVAQVDFEVRATAMGVEPGENFEDPEHDTLCIIELRDPEVYWLDEERRRRASAPNGAPGSTIAL